MIKDNHVAAAGGVAAAIALVRGRRCAPARARGRGRHAGATATRRSPAAPTIVLLDNMDTATVEGPSRGSPAGLSSRSRAASGSGACASLPRRGWTSSPSARSPRARLGSTWPSTWRSDGAARRRRREHADAPRGRRRRRRGRRVAHGYGAAPHQRRDRGDAAGALLPAGPPAHGGGGEVGVASVVPRLTQQWEEMCEKHLGIQAFVVGPGARTGMPILTTTRAGRPRPHRRRRRRVRLVRRPLHRRRLRHGDHLQRRLRGRATTSATLSLPASRSPWTRSPPAPPGS